MRFLIFLFSLSSLAFDDLDRGLRENIILSGPSFNEIDQLTEILKKIPTGNPFPKYPDPIEDAPIQKLLLKADTKVKIIASKEEKIIPKDTFVSGRLIKKTGNYQILNKKNLPAYEIKGSEVIPVDNAVDLAPTPLTYITYKRNELNKERDKLFSLTQSLSLNKQTIDADYFSEFFNTPTNSADALKLEYKIFHKTDFPIAFGLVASFEGGDYNGSGFTGLFIGAGVKTPLKISQDILLEAHVVFQRSIYIQLNSYSFSSFFIQGNIEAIFKNKYFLNLSLASATISADDQWINENSQSKTGTSVGIGLGIKFYTDINI